QAGPQEVGPFRGAQVHLGVDGPLGREGNLHLAGRDAQRTQEAGRPADGEQLFRVGAVARGTGGGQLAIKPAVRTAARAVAAAGGVCFGRVQHLVDLGHGKLLFKSGDWGTDYIGQAPLAHAFSVASSFSARGKSMSVSTTLLK